MLPLHRSLLAVAICAIVINESPILLAQTPSAPVESSAPARPAAAANSDELPDSPGTVWAKSQEPAQQVQQPVQQQEQTAAPANAPADQQTAQKQNDKLQRPVGTAAAEAPKVSGITAAQPAGIAMAPAKQRRVRTIVLKVGAILGASAAVGTVIALSAATPSKPPGAH